MKPVSVGLIGAGRIGRLHAECLTHQVSGARLVAIADVDRAAAERCARTLGVPAAYDDSRKILEDPQVDAVLICSSTDTHAPLIEAAARAGKHAFCEKPIDLELARIDRALQAVERAGIKLQVGFNRRFDPHFRRVREAVASGQIGAPHLLRITSRDPEPPPPAYVRVSGGLFLDMTIHDFDMARYLIGAEVETLYAVGAVRVDPRIGKAGDIDTAIVTLQFENGVLGTIDNSRRAVYGYDQRVEVFGAEGVVWAENETPHRARWGNREGFHGPPLRHFFLERYRDAYAAELEAFVACIHQDTDPPVTGRDGRVPVVMGLAARRSLEEGRPVKLSEIG